ncbi:hypothetical protein ESP131_04715 [Exiguobacterium sp. U13-1]|nr:hypothetical protein ESP131_04715 [Exiguobacterium sp. U13-1]
MKIKLMMDTMVFKSKPCGHEVPKINRRLLENQVSINIEDFAECVSYGKNFTPAFFEKKAGVINRRKEYWKSQQVVALDFDNGMSLKEAIEKFSDTAAFIYLTHSHTVSKPKFRVVFILNKPCFDFYEIENLLGRLLTLYPAADQKCKDCTRFFYGGKQLIELNYNNRINIDSFKTHNQKVFSGTYDCITNISRKKPKQTSHKYIHNKPNEKISSSEARNIDLIRSQNIHELHNRIVPSKKQFYSEADIVDYLKKQDLRKYLGIETTGAFKDIFSNDKNPSAGIHLSHEENGHQMYTCHSEKNSFSGTIFNVTKKICGGKNDEILEFLKKVYLIELIESPYQKELLCKIEDYERYLLSDEFKHENPNSHKILRKRNMLKNFLILLDISKLHLPQDEKSGVLFYHSLETLAKRMDKSKSATHRYINLFVILKMIKKLDDLETPPELLSLHKKTKADKQYKYYSSTYELVLPNKKAFFEEVEKMSTIWIEKGFTLDNVNYESMYRNYGAEEANRVYPQDKNREVPELNEIVTKCIEEKVLILIEKNNWTTEARVLEEVKLYFRGQKKFKEIQFKKCISDTMDKYGLERIRLNKILKEELEIESNGFGNIIRKLT